MKHAIGAGILVVALSIAAQVPQKATDLRVPDAATALKIAIPKLEKIYGRNKIESEQPFGAVLKNGVWFVVGSLWCSDGHGGRTDNCVGGVAQIRLRQTDGKVLSISHTK
ncbi:MAG: NTF2 fold immunity protein [Terracidiphilus sp.]